MTTSRLEVIQRQRRFDWALARDEQTHAARRLVAHKTHDLVGFVQIVRLVSDQLRRTADAQGQEFLDDLAVAADTAQAQLRALMELARPEEVTVRGAPIGPALAATRTALAGAIALDVDLTAEPTACTRCTAAELDYLVTAIALDAATDTVPLLVRARTVEGRPWLEVLRATATEPSGDRPDLIGLEALAARRGGELTRSELRGGGEELVLALPLVPEGATGS